jgi:hypothetical protein
MATAVDVDQDGDLDLVQQWSWDGSGLLTVMENQGNGLLVPRVHPPANGTMWFSGITAGDIDGDRDADVVFAGYWDVLGGADRRDDGEQGMEFCACVGRLAGD